MEGRRRKPGPFCRPGFLSGFGRAGPGYEGLLEQEDNEGKERLSPVFEELTQAAGRLRETKESADRILNVRLRQIQHISGLSGGPHYDEYG